MHKTKQYQAAILAVFHDYDTAWGNAGGLENRIIADTQRNAFVLLTFGWQNSDIYTHLLCFHLEIKDGKVWVHENNTDVMVAVKLIEHGVSPEDIVLGFVEPYAVAVPRLIGH